MSKDSCCNERSFGGQLDRLFQYAHCLQNEDRPHNNRKRLDNVYNKIEEELGISETK